jgi:anti-sigma factor RsiW
MSCIGEGGERELQITAYLDDELDLTSAIDLERHLEECPACARAIAAQRALRQAIGAADLRFRPTPPQARRLRRAFGAQGRSGWWQHPQLRAIAALLLVAVAAWSVGRRWPAPPAPGTPATTAAPAIMEQVIASHVRAQLSGHPEDVASSDRHTVKPWFGGRLDYSPPVIDLAAQGFPLRGGRLEYVGGRPVATLVYQAGNHLVSVLVWPVGAAAGAAGAASAAVPADGADAPPGAVAASSQRGFHLRRWSQAGMTWWAVSDVAEDRLDELVRRLRAELPPPAAR